MEFRYNLHQNFVNYYQSFLSTVTRRMRVPENYQEDLTQTVLIKVWKALPSFEVDPSRAKFRTWLSTIIRNAFYDFVRSEKNHALSSGTEELLNAYQDPKSSHVVEMIEKEWERHIVKLAFIQVRSKFTDRAVRALEMTLKGKDIKEISETLDMKENSTYKLRNRAKKFFLAEIYRLREELENA